MASDETTPACLSADRALKSPSDDLLGYADFAKMLAHSVLRGSPADGLVVGIYGEWGLGKTTLLNFIEHYTMADAEDDTPIVVHFNPWWSSGREDLLRRFFKEFQTAVLRDKAHKEKVNKIIQEQLQKFGDAIANAPAALFASLGFPSWLGAPVGRAIGAIFRTASPPDIVGLKKELADALAAQALRVIVLIDDIDRLLPSEMVDVLRLVRSVADFPNVHYVLVFDREVVSTALQAECRTDGVRYLEKIIQVPFDLPRPSAFALRTLFAKGLARILSNTDSELTDDRYWNGLFEYGIAPFLQTPRQVLRLLNALAVIYPSLENEVNPADFVAVEALRVFVPRAYGVICQHRARFVGIALVIENLRNDNQQFHENWLSDIDDKYRDTVRALVVRLFPSVGAVLTNSNGGPDRDAVLRRMRRICVASMFDIYFRYSLTSGLTRKDFMSVLSCDPAVLGSRLTGLAADRLDDGQPRLISFLEMLRDELIGGAKIARADLVRELLRLGDTLSGVQSGTYDFFFARVLLKLLECTPAPERGRVLTSALESASVGTAALIVAASGQQHGRYGGQGVASEERVVRESELGELERTTRMRLVRASEDGTLWSDVRFPRLLFEWRRFNDEARVRGIVGKWCADNRNMFRLLSSLQSLPSGAEASIDMGAVALLLDLDETAARAKKLLVDPTIDAKAKRLLQLMLEGYAVTAEARKEQEARSKIFDWVFDQIETTKLYPNKTAMRGVFKEEKAVLDRLFAEGALRDILTDSCIITIEACQKLLPDPRARYELRGCRLLLEEVTRQFESDPKSDLDLEAFAARLADQGFDVGVMRRAALGLMVRRDGAPAAVSTYNSAGMPSAVRGNLRCLELKPSEIIEDMEGERRPAQAG